MKRTADGEAKEVEEQEEEEGVPAPQQPDAVAEGALQNFTPEQQLAYQQQWQAYYQQQQYYQQQTMVEQGPPYYGTFGRPARKQTKEIEKFDTGATNYNIWYHKVCGEYPVRGKTESRQLSKFRCNPRKDSGITRAQPGGHICIYFARGKCVRGSDCTYYHRIPDVTDEKNLDITYDIFGRERHRTDRDDMGGVGSFSRENRTLYLGGIRKIKGVDLEDLLMKNFREWGELEYARVIYDKSIGFVRYKLRAAAEFAKEAMSDQSLGYHEVINVRWANEDPNPTAQQKGTDELEERVRLAVLAKMQEDPQYPDMSGLQSGDAYPNTNEQYLTYTGEEQPALSLVPYEETSDPTTTTTTPTASYYPAITPPPGLGGPASTESAPVSLPPGLAQQPSEPKQQEYTKEQWKAWYLYYYGYVPPEFDAEPTSDDPSLSSPASAEQVAEEGKDQKDASDDDEEKEKEIEGEKETRETKKRKVLA